MWPICNESEIETKKRQYWNKVEIGMDSESRVAAAKMSPDSFVNKIIPEKLKEHSLNFKEFTALKVKPDYMLNDKEITIMQDIRDSVPLPDKNTTFIKNLPSLISRNILLEIIQVLKALLQKQKIVHIFMTMLMCVSL